MIRRDFILDDGRAGWLLVEQIAHAELAGNLADAWQVDGILPSLAGDLRTAIHRHDDGWADWDSRPAVDPLSGQPIEFDEMRLADSLAIWTRSIDLAALRDPILGYFVAGHFTRLLRRFDSWRGDPAREELAREFLTRQDGDMGSWLAATKASRQEADRGVAYLQFFDAVSLWLCCAKPDEPRRIELSGGEGWTFSPESQEQDCQLVRIDPWPLPVGSCELSVSGRAVPRAHYRSTDEMLAVAGATELKIGWRVIP
jgi:hypothetical protein